MTPTRRRRMAVIGLVLGGVTVSSALALQAFRENLMYSYYPTQVAEGEAPVERRFRLGGMVLEDSVRREEGSLIVRFVVTDYANDVPVTYNRVLPDLFQEGKGVVVEGRLDESGLFTADEVLARHDENYMSPGMAEAIEKGRQAAGE